MMRAWMRIGYGDIGVTGLCAYAGSVHITPRGSVRDVRPHAIAVLRVRPSL